MKEKLRKIKWSKVLPVLVAAFFFVMMMICCCELLSPEYDLMRQADYIPTAECLYGVGVTAAVFFYLCFVVTGGCIIYDFVRRRES